MTTPVSTSRRGGRTPTRSNLSAHPGAPSGLRHELVGRRRPRRAVGCRRIGPAGSRAAARRQRGRYRQRGARSSSPRPPWYRTRPAAIALIAAAAAAASQSSSWRSAAPPQTSRTRPASRLAAPAWPASSQLPARPLHPSAVAPPPPPPAPPPPPSAEQISPPSGGGGYRPRPRTATPQETDKPRIDVTRAPMSVAPEPRTPPKTAAPGGNSGNGGGWPW